MDLELLDVAITTHDPSGGLIQANALARGLAVDLAAATAGAVERALRDRCAARGTMCSRVGMMREITASATNVYDRANIFYFDRVYYERVNQLPIIPSLSMTVQF